MTEKVPGPIDFSGLTFNSVDVFSLAQELLESDDAIQNGRTARTLAKGKELTVVLTVIRAGHGLDEHAARGPLTMAPIIGAVEFSFDGEPGASSVLAPGRLVLIGKGRSHRVHARENAAFLILIGFQD
jgi:quercetin dioxygenase-like cupin family protein